MPIRQNLKIRQVDYTPKVATLLRVLLDGPKLAVELPKFSNELTEAEALGLCQAECLAKHNDAAKPSVWRWTITATGTRWIKVRDNEKRQRPHARTP